LTKTGHGCDSGIAQLPRYRLGLNVALKRVQKLTAEILNSKLAGCLSQSTLAPPVVVETSLVLLTELEQHQPRQQLKAAAPAGTLQAAAAVA
jgi:hypothetical protein